MAAADDQMQKSLKEAVFVLLDGSSSPRRAAAAAVVVEAADLTRVDEESFSFLKAAVVLLLHKGTHVASAMHLAGKILSSIVEKWPDFAKIIHSELRAGKINLILGMMEKVPDISYFYQTYVQPSLGPRTGRSFSYGLMKALDSDEN